MSPDRRNGSPPQGAAAKEIKHHSSTDHHDDSAGRRQRGLIAVAFASPPIGRRSMWTLVVSRCVACGYVHVHRVAGSHGGRRTGSCGVSYRIVIAGQRKGAA